MFFLILYNVHHIFDGHKNTQLDQNEEVKLAHYSFDNVDRFKISESRIQRT